MILLKKVEIYVWYDVKPKVAIIVINAGVALSPHPFHELSFNSV